MRLAGAWKDRRAADRSLCAPARTREAMHNSWDKNDPKDAQVILHLLKTGLAQTWHDPMVNGINDVQELSKTHFQVMLARVRVWGRVSRRMRADSSGTRLTATSHDASSEIEIVIATCER